MKPRRKKKGFKDVFTSIEEFLKHLEHLLVLVSIFVMLSQHCFHLVIGNSQEPPAMKTTQTATEGEQKPSAFEITQHNDNTKD